MEFSREELEAEIAEKTKDLEVFAQARIAIRRRVLEVVDSGSRLTPLPRWSGTDAVLGTLDLVCHSIEHTLEELAELLARMPGKPKLRVVNEDEPI